MQFLMNNLCKNSKIEKTKTDRKLNFFLNFSVLYLDFGELMTLCDSGNLSRGAVKFTLMFHAADQLICQR